MFRIESYDAGEFAARVVPALVAREAENNLLLGVNERALRVANAYPDAIWLGVFADEQLVGAAARTPPHWVTVSRLPPGAAEVLVDWLIENGHAADGASGPAPHGRDVASLLAARTGGALELCMGDVLYELTELREARRPSGSARLAVEDDHAVVTRFLADFTTELNLPHSGDPAAGARGGIAEQAFFLWDDGGPVSLARIGRRTPSGASIGPVYTPPEARGRGYASAITGHVTQRLLASGLRFVCLFADRNNPTSNRIYQALGFRALGDFDVWRIQPP